MSSPQSVEILMESARAYHGREFDREQVREIARYIMALENASNTLFVRATGAENMLNAYLNEFGEELMTELLKDEMDVIEGEIVGDADEETTGLPGKDDIRLDAQVKGEEE